jgi:drug/metabolite transporter superfamily protein YnfA
MTRSFVLVSYLLPDEARRQMARYFLSNSVLKLNEAAYLLGFEDPNSFGRAFRAWEGGEKRIGHPNSCGQNRSR